MVLTKIKCFLYHLILCSRCNSPVESEGNGLTPAMEEVLRRREQSLRATRASRRASGNFVSKFCIHLALTMCVHVHAHIYIHDYRYMVYRCTQIYMIYRYRHTAYYYIINTII